MERYILKDKVIVITGGAGLIGKELVKSVLNEGGICIISDSNSEIGTQFASDLQEKYSSNNVVFFKTDITNKNSLLDLIDYVNNKFGKIDALVNNAYPRNKNFGRHFFEVEYKDFCENINLNLGGYFLSTQVFADFFITQGYGNIISMASIYGVIPPRFEIYNGTKMGNSVEYAIIKSGLIHFNKYLVKYLKGKNIRINTISPGGILDSQPTVFLENYKAYCSNKGMLDPKDITGTLIFLLSEMSENINGHNIIVDDGFTL